jgi:hypothetical protein
VSTRREFLKQAAVAVAGVAILRELPAPQMGGYASEGAVRDLVALLDAQRGEYTVPISYFVMRPEVWAILQEYAPNDFVVIEDSDVPEWQNEDGSFTSEILMCYGAVPVVGG